MERTEKMSYEQRKVNIQWINIFVIVFVTIIVATALAFATGVVLDGRKFSKDFTITVSLITFLVLFISIITLGVRFYIIKIKDKIYVDAEQDALSTVSDLSLRDVETARKVRLERSKKLELDNLKHNFLLSYVQITEGKEFNNIRWSPKEKVNILLGRNGYGKSYFLKLLVGILSYDNERLHALIGQKHKKFQIELIIDKDIVDIKHDGEDFLETVGKIPILAIPDSRFINRSSTKIAPDEGEFADLSFHGSHHFLYDKSYDNSIQTIMSQMCIEAIGGSGDIVNNPKTEQLNLISKLMLELSNERFYFRKVVAVGSGRFEIFVESEANPGEILPIQRTSQGTMSVVAIFGLIYQYLKSISIRRDSNTKITKQHGIVLIDEVDAHLHPMWQRKIVFLLRKFFPNVQFFLTAHSPLVAAGCNAGEVTVLKLEDKKLQLFPYNQDLIGEDIKNIYQDLFGISQKDPAFLNYYADLPIVKELERDLTNEKAVSNPDIVFIQSLENRLDKIKQVKKHSDKELDTEILEEENEQLTSQVELLKKRLSKFDQGVKS
jgi:energy-coupling factor transporter ATP-binding protein EcfA2